MPRVNFSLQGMSERLFPIWENMWWKNCVFLPAEGKQNATFLSDFAQPGKSLLEIPCTKLLRSDLLDRGAESDNSPKLSSKSQGLLATNELSSETELLLCTATAPFHHLACSPVGCSSPRTSGKGQGRVCTTQGRMRAETNVQSLA